MTSTRLIFVNRFYWPDEPATAQLLTDLAEGLAGSGFPVTVLARWPGGTTPLAEVRNGVQITRISTSRWGKRNLFGRAFDFVTFVSGVRRVLRSTLRSSDILVTMTDPPLLGTAVMGIVQSRRGHWIHWVQDIFPEVASAVSGRRWANILIPSRNRSWQAADRCVVPGADMATFVHAQGVPTGRLVVSENWGPAGLRETSDSDWRRVQGLTGKFIVMYSGNMGRVHDFSVVAPLAEAFPESSNVVFVFIGKGAQRHVVEKRLRDRGLHHVRFLPPEPRESLAPALSAADLHWLTLRSGCERLVFPSKLYGIAAIGRPALVVGPANCEPARVVREFGFGEGFTPGQVPEIVSFIRNLQTNPTQASALRQAARDFGGQRASFSRALETWKTVLAPLIQLAGSGTPSTESRPTP